MSNPTSSKRRPLHSAIAIVAIVVGCSSSRPIEERLRDRNWATRVGAVEELGASKDRDRAARLLAPVAVADPYPYVRVVAIRQLSAKRLPAAIPPLIDLAEGKHALSDPWEKAHIQGEVVRGLGRIADLADLSVLQRLVELWRPGDHEAGISLDVEDILPKFGDRVIAPMRAILEDPCPPGAEPCHADDQRCRAIDVLARVYDPEARALVERYLSLATARCLSAPLSTGIDAAPPDATHYRPPEN
jgi:HEAT repeat protein